MVTQVKEHNRKVVVPSRRSVSLPFGLKAHELVAAVAVLTFFILTLIFYFWTLKPKQEEIATLQNQLDKLKQTETKAITDLKKGKQPFVDEAKDALESLESFKQAHLKPLSAGRIALINEINAMAKKNNVSLTSGIDMTMDRARIAAEGEKEDSKRKSLASFLRVFPNLDMRFTIAGEYKNLRQFISDLEANKQFKTIESISLNAIKEREGPRGRRTEVVSGIALTITMTVFFNPEYR